ncbi:hypothetical protein [Streptomyces sp. cg40]|uniref:hypothetical protein n=1 Tax=Streptomyces sp. cg40 TaxID=3419764 RepID=UPI003D035619
MVHSFLVLGGRALLVGPDGRADTGRGIAPAAVRAGLDEQRRQRHGRRDVSH